MVQSLQVSTVYRLTQKLYIDALRGEHSLQVEGTLLKGGKYVEVLIQEVVLPSSESVRQITVSVHGPSRLTQKTVHLEVNLTYEFTGSIEVSQKVHIESFFLGNLCKIKFKTVNLRGTHFL